MAQQLDLEHVVRGASFPWRGPDATKTECGLLAQQHESITRDELVAKYRRLGQTRASMTTCITCYQTATRYGTWEQNPVDAVRREVLGMRRDEERFKRELWALAALVAAHPEQFQAFLTGLEQTADLAAKRRDRRRARG